MGLLDWFRRRRCVRTLCWIDEKSRVAGLVRDVQNDIAAGRHVLVVAHFPAALIEVGRSLAAAGIDFETRDRWSSEHDRQLSSAGPARPVALLAKSLPAWADSQPRSPARGHPRVSVRLCELHVLANENLRVLNFAAQLPVAAEAVAHVSLDGPQMGSMVGARVKGMMRALGMKDDEPIDNPMVTRAVDRGRSKLEKRVRGDQPAESLAQWMQLNMRSA